MPKAHETLEKVGLLRSLDGKTREAFEQRCQWRHAHPKEWLLEQIYQMTERRFKVAKHLL